MPRPNNKESLVDLSKNNFVFLLDLSYFIPVNVNFDITGKDKNVCDVLTHLYKWSKMMLQCYNSGMSTMKTHITAENYNFQDLSALNYKIWQQYQNTSLEKILTLIKDSHIEVMNITNKHTNAELFTKRYYSWTATTSLGSYLTSATSNHYDWGTKTLKKLKRIILTKQSDQ